MLKSYRCHAILCLTKSHFSCCGGFTPSTGINTTTMSRGLTRVVIVILIVLLYPSYRPYRPVLVIFLSQILYITNRTVVLKTYVFNPKLLLNFFSGSYISSEQCSCRPRRGQRTQTKRICSIPSKKRCAGSQVTHKCAPVDVFL